MKITENKPATSKEIIKRFVQDQKFDSASQILDYLKDMFKEILEESLNAEMDEMLGYSKSSIEGHNTGNSRNGYTKKTVRTELGPVELKIPRDRKGEFDSLLVPKNERTITGVDEKVIDLYACGMTTRDIAEQLKALYGIDVSSEYVSNVTNSILPAVKEWQTRPLESVYPFIFLDAIHYKVHDERAIACKAAYVALGVNMNGEKDVLGIWIGESESSKFWLGVLTDMRNRGVETVLVFCVDGLTGFKEAIGAAYPTAKIQRCIIHQIRSSTKYVPTKDMKPFIADLKRIYTAVNSDAALSELHEAEAKWGAKYPHGVNSWKENWDNLSTFFDYPDYMRKIMYTTNAIESLNSQFRKLTKTKLIFPNDESLMKMMYLAVKKISAKWSRRYVDWDKVLNHINIIFADQLNK